MLNHHLAGLLGLGSLSWAGHQIHVSLPVNKLLDAGVDPKEIPLPHEFLLNRQIMQDLYPSFAKGLAPFFTLQWGEYSDFLTFNGGLNPVTGGLWLSDTAHHHLAIAVLFLVAGHMYRTNWGIGHSMREILDAHKGPFTGEGHVGLYEILTTSWHAQLAINLALFGSLSIIVACCRWVTLNPTVCWDTPFAMFEAMPQVLVLSFLSVFSILFAKQQTLVEMVSKILRIEQRNNLVGRSNQQETETNHSGSSETLRGTFVFSTFFSVLNKNSKHFSPSDFSNFFKASSGYKDVQQLSSSKKNFLEWFLGFAEGDGSFGIRDGRPIFVINQAEIEILRKIRSELGFGTVFPYKQAGRVYARYLVTDKKGIIALIHLFNGNIHLQKVYDRFTTWVECANQIFSCSIPFYEPISVKVRRSPNEISFSNAWLSGFFDAEGGFYVGLTEVKKAGKMYHRLRLNAYIDQKNELDVLKQIQVLFCVANVTTRSVEKKTYRVNCCTKKSIEKILSYFENYNLRSKKHLVYSMWRKIAFSYLEHKHFENFEQLLNRIDRIHMQNRVFKETKTVLPK